MEMATRRISSPLHLSKLEELAVGDVTMATLPSSCARARGGLCVCVFSL